MSKIKQAAFRSSDGSVQGTGPFHDISALPLDFQVSEEGFITEDGRFVSREDAAAEVNAAPHAVESEELNLAKSSVDYHFEGPVPDGQTNQHKVVAYDNDGKPIGKVTFASKTYSQHPYQGYHMIGEANVHEGHRGNGVYGRMLQIASSWAKANGGKGLVSTGDFRSPEATGAWQKLQSKGIPVNAKPDPSGAATDFYLSENPDPEPLEHYSDDANIHHEFDAEFKRWMKLRGCMAVADEVDAAAELAEALEKKTPPPLPKLGVDPRPTATMVTNQDQVHLRHKLMADAHVQNHGPVTSDVVRRLASSKTANNLDAVESRHGLSAKGPRELAYAKAGKLLPAMAGPKSPIATQLHEDFHQMMNRIGQEHGEPARRNLAMNLFNAIPRQHREFVQHYYQTVTKDKSPNYEEMIAHLHNYLNDPLRRRWFHDKNGTDDIIGFDTMMKRAHRNLWTAAEVADRRWLQPRIQKSEEDLDDLFNTHGNLDGGPSEDEHKVAAHMAGYDPEQSPEFKAARFIAGGEPAPADAVRTALILYDTDFELAALRAYGLPRNDHFRGLLRNIIVMQERSQGLQKAEMEVDAIPRKVEAALPESRDVTEALRRAFAKQKVHAVHLNGKHSKGAAIATDPQDGVRWILKPGSGKISPAAGVQQEAANQSRREACFYEIAEEIGLSRYLPECHLVILDGTEVAAMELLNTKYRGLDKARRAEDLDPRKIFEPYRKDGTLFKWALLDWVLGNADRHANNIMVDEQENIKLIDHGSTFAGTQFDPADDLKSFVPYYLRVWSTRPWHSMDADERLEGMPTADQDIESQFSDWVKNINRDKIAEICKKYGINATPVLYRLENVRHSGVSKPLGQLLDFWCGALVTDYWSPL